MIYFTIFLFLLFLAIAYDFLNIKKGRDFSYFLSYLILVLLSGFRYKVGGDTYNYMYTHEYLPNMSNLFIVEVGIAKLQPLWLLLSAVAKSISEDFYVLQIIHALIVNAAIFIFIKQNTHQKHTGILFYYFALYPYFNFEIMRESLAIACFLTSIKYYNKDRWVPYYVLTAVAFSFHLSAVLLFFLPLIKRVSINLYFIPIVFVISSLLNPAVLWMVNTSIAANILGYAVGYAENNYTIWGLVSLFLFFVLNPLLITIIARDVFKIDSNYYGLAKSGLLIVSLMPLFYIFFRFYNYFSILFVLLAAGVLQKLNRSKRNLELKPVLLPIVFGMFVFIYTVRYFGNTSDLAQGTRWYSFWYPYYSIFDPNLDPSREQLVHSMQMQIQ